MTPPVLRLLRRTRVRPEAVGAATTLPRKRTAQELTPVPDTGDRDRELVDKQLLRLEARLLAEVAGDPAAELDTRRWLAIVGAHFAAAPVRQYLRILVEREARGRLRDSRHCLPW